MRYRYFVNFRHGILVFTNFSCGIGVYWVPPNAPLFSWFNIGISFQMTDPNRYVVSTTLAGCITVFSFSYYFRPLGLVCYFLYSCDSAAFLVAFNLDLFVSRLTLSYSMCNFPLECIFCYCFRLNYYLPSFPNHSHLVAFYCVSVPSWWDNCTMTIFDYNYKNSFRFCFVI